MKIGFFTTTYYPTPDGVSHYLRDVKQELESRGHEVHVFSYNGDRKEKNVHIPATFPFPVYPQYRVPLNPFPMHMYKMAGKVGFDIVHIHDPFMGSLGYRLAKSMNLPVIASFHTDFARMREALKMPFKDFLIRLSWRYNKYLFRRCNTVLAPSVKTTEYLKVNGIGNSEELPLFVDTGKFHPVGKKGGEFTIQYLGRVTRDKGVYRILDVAESLRRMGNAKFIISGTGPEAVNLGREARRRHLEDVVSLTGYIDEGRKLELLNNADLFIYPSDSDTFGISVLEALSAGIPAIVTEDFPLTQYSNHGNSGLIEADFSDPDSVAGKILELMDKPSLLESEGKSARKFVMDKFSMGRHCDRLTEIYETQIAGTGNGH